MKKRSKIKRRIRKKIGGTSERPRLSVYRSNNCIYAQIIDDTKGVTLISYSSTEKDFPYKKNMNKTEQAILVGEKLAKKALNRGIKRVVFDRNGYLYHGRVKALAESARKVCLKF